MKAGIVSRLISLQLFDNDNSSDLINLPDDEFAAFVFKRFEEYINNNHQLFSDDRVDVECLSLYKHMPMLPAFWLMLDSSSKVGFEFNYNVKHMLFVIIKLTQVVSSNEVEYILNLLNISSVEKLAKAMSLVSCNSKCFFSKSVDKSVVTVLYEADHLIREFILEQCDTPERDIRSILIDTDNQFKQLLSKLISNDETIDNLTSKKLKESLIKCSGQEFKNEYMTFITTKMELRLHDLDQIKHLAAQKAVQSRAQANDACSEFKTELKKRGTGYSITGTFSF